MTHFILIRHGETEWNRVVRFRGRADISLNDVGLVQAAATGRRVAATWRPAAIYSSPMRRARQTATAIGERINLPVQPHAGLYDIDFGQLQGLTVDEAMARWPEVVRSWAETPAATRFPGGEGLGDLAARSTAMLQELTARHENETVVLVGHTVINRVILLGVLGLGLERFWHLGQDTCAINLFEATAGDYVLHSLNDVCHLRDLAP